METKHTPGPWYRLTGGIISATVGADWASDRHFVAQVGRHNEANAALIAAAPDLLKACRAAFADYEADTFQQPTMAMLRAAIARAEAGGDA